MKSATLQEEAQKFGARAADKIGSVVEKAGTKVDAAIEFVNDKTQQASERVQQATQSWDGVRRRATDCARNSPFTTFLVTMGMGMVIGWFLGRQTK